MALKVHAYFPYKNTWKTAKSASYANDIRHNGIILDSARFLKIIPT